MAKVTITIEDINEGASVDIKLASDPPFPNPINPKQRMQTATNAQIIAAQLYKDIIEAYRESPE